MKRFTVSIRGLDALLFRDGRPFDATPGSVATGLESPYPSTIAGFVRTHIGRKSSCWDLARQVVVEGPLLTYSGETLLPAPADALIYPSGQGMEVMRLTPVGGLPEGAGTDAPGGLTPLAVGTDVKTAGVAPWWTWEQAMKWLEGGTPAIRKQLHLRPPRQERVHVEISRDTRTSQEGKLFSTSMVGFEALSEDHHHQEWAYLCRVSVPEGLHLEVGPGPLGGERRLGLIETTDAPWPLCPETLRTKLVGARGVRMQLATPAIFARGWCPGWIDKTTREGSPPGLESVRLKLVSAAVPRRQAVSGWEMEGNRPKPVRWLAPAGSVYFFEVLSGDPTVLSNLGWLDSVSDLEEQRDGDQRLANNRADGFGLAVWGVWEMGDQR